MNRPISRITGGVESVSRSLFGIFATLLVFGAAMGVLEAAVVVYMREFWYPAGFGFPTAEIPADILAVEIWREVATLVMLGAVAFLAGKRFFDRFLYFLFTFGIWDIVYYVGLKLFVGWPPSLFTWDVLFLIPVTWVGPVLAPVLCSLTMIAMSIVLVTLEENGYRVRTSPLEVGLLIAGALMIFAAFVWDFTAMLVASGFSAGSEAFAEAVGNYVPESFHWGLFLLGEALVIAFVVLSIRNSRRLI
ncbi:MAG TPA: hypothetical protein DCG87_03320 [Synergistaceae bacterium]|nr:hypothetical protein [Synergistaceae bacterium]